MKNKDEKEQADILVAYLDGEGFQYYFDNFAEENTPTEKVKSFQKSKTAFLEKF